MNDDTHNLAQKLRDEELLLSKGYVKQKCTNCGGKVSHAYDVFANFCSVCKGRGWVWKAPLMR